MECSATASVALESSSRRSWRSCWSIRAGAHERPSFGQVKPGYSFNVRMRKGLRSETQTFWSARESCKLVAPLFHRIMLYYLAKKKNVANGGSKKMKQVGIPPEIARPLASPAFLVRSCSEPAQDGRLGLLIYSSGLRTSLATLVCMGERRKGYSYHEQGISRSERSERRLDIDRPTRDRRSTQYHLSGSSWF